MMKKLLFTGTTALFGIGVLGMLLTNSADQNYNPRPVSGDNDQEPNAMMWAKIDNRTGEYNPSARAEVTRMIQNRVSRDVALGDIQFASKGPDNVGGRTRSIIELYGKPDTLYAGGVTGGVYASYDAGATWAPLEGFQNAEETSAIIASMHQDTNSGSPTYKTIYVGTGSSFDAYASTARVSWPGYGIFQSTDDGETWTHIESTTPSERYSTQGDPWIAVNRIRTNSKGWIYAATERGLQLSKDGGDTWENPVYQNNQQLEVNGKCADVIVTDEDKVLVAYYGGQVFLSEDGDVKTFELVNGNGLPASGNRVGLAWSKDTASGNDVMYALHTTGDACLNVVSKSTDGGESWESILFPHDDFTPMQGGSFCQGTYDLAFIASPTDPECIFIGGVELWRFDGGLARVATEFGSPPFQDVLDFYVHADKHYFYFSPNDPKKLYVTSDGGVSYTTNKGQNMARNQ